MIAELAEKCFDKPVFDRKVDYHQKKIDNGVGEYLYSSLGCEDLKSFMEISELVVSKNDRVKFPFHEVSMNLPDGESLSNEDLTKLAIEYMEMFGAGDHSYAIIRHKDKHHEHAHVLFTTVDIEGKWLNNFNERLRSQRISRELEQKWGLKVTESKNKNNFSLKEIKAREYYFHNTLVKGLKSYSTKENVEKLLNKVNFDAIDILKSPKTNIEYELLLGDNIYKEVGAILEKNHLFKSLYKEELLSKMDLIFATSNSIKDFRTNLENDGIYMRFLTDKGKSKYVYGLPDVPIYFNDKSLPMKYRFGNLEFEKSITTEITIPVVQANNLIPVDEQKHIVYNLAFLALEKSSDYSEYKNILKASGVELIEHRNARGVYGLSFQMINTDNAELFKASDISRRLSYKSINSYFSINNTSVVQEYNNVPIFTVVKNETILNEMQQSLDDVAPRHINSNNQSFFDDDLSLLSGKRRRRKRGKGYNI
jgi:hypothetical protein